MVAQIVVDSRAAFDPVDVGEEAAAEIRAAFMHENPKHAAMRHAKIRGWWNEPKVIPTWGERGSQITVPRGGMKKLREILRIRGISYRVVDARQAGQSADFPDSSLELWPHQRRIVDACLRRENCLIKSGTASGKTSALLAFVGSVKVTTLVIVHTNALAEQWAERAVDELGIDPSDIGLLGGGSKTVRDLTIGTTQSIAAMCETDPEFRNRWGAVIADEVHLFAARTFFATVDPFPARYRIGASDDHRRKDRQEFLIEDLFGQVEEEVSDKELVDGGHVMPVEVFVIPTEFRADWYGVPTDGDEAKTPEFGRLVEEMSLDPERRALVEGVIARELEEKHQVLVMANSRDYCRALAAFASTRAKSGHLLGGADYRKEFARTRKGMKEGKIRCGVGTFKATGTGIDLPGVEVVVAATPCLANKSMFRQARGRAMRKPAGKTTARVYVAWDQHVFGLRHLANAASWNEATFVWDGSGWAPAKAWLRNERRVTRGG
jgi:superfamily II DNA or RNA helicase